MTHAETPHAALTWPQLLETLLEGTDLTGATMSWAMDQIMTGKLSDAQVAGFLIALRAKGISVPELTALSESMMDHAVPADIPGPTLDIVGTGGDMLGTVNISTMSSLVAVGAGTRVVKHGNRGASSTAGAADVIEALGVDLDLPVPTVLASAEEVGITFLFAQQFHPSMKYVAPARKGLGVRTVFNFLGPISNPARVTAQALGCSAPELAPQIAEVLALRGTRGLVFRGRDGRDKITTSDETDIWEVRDGQVHHTVLAPEDVGLQRRDINALRGGTGVQNADVVRDLLAGEPGPVRDAVLINTAAGLTAWEETAHGGLLQRLKTGMQLAAESIDSGQAAAVLQRWVEHSSAS